MSGFRKYSGVEGTSHAKGPRLLRLTNFLVVVTVVLSACFEPPMPSVRVYHQRGALNQTEKTIKELANESVTRERVVKTLGVPIAYKADFVSYIACGRQGGIDFYGEAISYRTGWDGGPQYECYELVITFDEQGRVSGYKKSLVTDVAHSMSEEKRAQNLREFADQGDTLAQMLLEETVLYQAEHGDGAAQYKLYNSDQTRQSKFYWLCRAADSGYAPAQAEVGRLYRWGLLGVKADYQRAYQWYWRANHQVSNSWKSELDDVKHTALSTKTPLTTEIDITSLPSDQCARELLSDF